MWIYQQSTGRLWSPSGDYLSGGYSGFGEGKNNTLMQRVKNVGPIPRGLYKIGVSYNSKNVGPMCLPLTPINHDALGRTDFLIHGDSIKKPGTASHGCIILARAIRDAVNSSRDKFLMVIE